MLKIGKILILKLKKHKNGQKKHQNNRNKYKKEENMIKIVLLTIFEFNKLFLRKNMKQRCKLDLF